VRGEEALFAHPLAQRGQARGDGADAPGQEVRLQPHHALADDRAHAIDDVIVMASTHQRSPDAGVVKAASVGRKGRSSQSGRRSPPGPGPGRVRARHSR
jgi:hypothetical protein